MPLDAPTTADPAAIAERIACELVRWLRPDVPERVIDSTAPPPDPPGDIMILVRRRDASSRR